MYLYAEFPQYYSSCNIIVYLLLSILMQYIFPPIYSLFVDEAEFINILLLLLSYYNLSIVYTLLILGCSFACLK